MISKIIEATHDKNGLGNWGKFLVQTFGPEETRHESTVDVGRRLLMARGWSAGGYVMVTDLETGEGALFRHGGYAPYDLRKHRVHVCPLFEPFLAWLYKQDIRDITKLPSLVELPDAPFAVFGYRRPGPAVPSRRERLVREARRVRLQREVRRRARVRG